MNATLTFDDDLELVKCDDCDAMITAEEFDEQNGSCKACFDRAPPGL